MRQRFAFVPLLTLAIVVLLTFAAYWPGLHGGFLFDDFINLPTLGASGPVDTWPTFWRYITSGTADPTGRPLTLLTFLIDAHDWPADPYSFKLTNVILHLVNGVILALLLRRLGREAFDSANAQRIDLAAAIGAGFWLLHPLFVSTTLYIVQREAMLPATFTMLGLLAWLHGRTAILRGRNRIGLMWIVIGLGVCTLFGTLSKANGILLPALALAVEYFFLQNCSPKDGLATSAHQQKWRIYRRSMALMGWLPTAMVTGYLLEQGWSGVIHGISSARPWTLGQRLLTEPRVLLDYLDLLWLPRPFTPGLFNDHIQASTSLWSPASTLPALLAVLALIAGAWLLRRRWPAMALAIIFYFIGQSLESSTVPLELYFEHRNYLPATLMFWPLALWLCSVRTHPDSTRIDNTIAPESAHPGRSVRVWKLALAALILLGMGLMTHARASLWGNGHDQALLWAKLNPDSPRAQAYAAQAEIEVGQFAFAASRLRNSLTKFPDQVQLALNLFNVQCQRGHIDSSTLAASREALRTTRDAGTLLTSWFDSVIEQLPRSRCPQLTYTTLDNLLRATLDNKHLSPNPGRQQDIHYLLGRLALSQSDADTSLLEFNRALDKQVRVPLALKQASQLGARGFPQYGLAHLDHLAETSTQIYIPGFGMPRIHAWVLQRQNYWPEELAHLRATLRGDAANQASHNP